MPYTLIRNDITTCRVDAIVNAANVNLKMGGGVCGAIFSAAGAGKLQKACEALAPIKTGEAVITKGYALPARYIIHTAGPVYHDGKPYEETLLRMCYINALDLANKHGCKSVAFPLISSGAYGYPKERALIVATGAISQWLMKNDLDVLLVVYDKTAFMLSNELTGKVRAFIDENYIDERKAKFDRSSRLYEDVSLDYMETEACLMRIDSSLQAPQRPVAYEAETISKKLLHEASPGEFIGRLDEPFSATLLRLIDAKGKTDIEIYKRANIDRKLFSKIRTGKGYMPSKKTAVAFAVALELSLPETRDLLERAGFALSRSVMFDVIIEYFITRKHYGIFDINNVLFEYDQPLLGG